LNAEAVVVELRVPRSGGRGIQETGFFEAMRSRVLDINLEENPFPELCVVRTLIMASKLECGLTKRLARYVLHHTTKMPLEQLEKVQLSHYGVVKYSVDTLHFWAKAIGNQIGTASAIKIPSRRPLQLHFWNSPLGADLPHARIEPTLTPLNVNDSRFHVSGSLNKLWS